MSFRTLCGKSYASYILTHNYWTKTVKNSIRTTN